MRSSSENVGTEYDWRHIMESHEIVYIVKRPSYEFCFAMPRRQAAQLSAGRPLLQVHFKGQCQISELGGVSDLHFGSQICHIASLVKEVMMVLIPVFCPHCQSDQVIKGGKTQVSKQRYKCQNAACPHYSFQLDLTYKGRSPEIKDRIIEMALNGSGIRDTARVLKISPTTVINELKKKRRRSAV
jgi:transposase-like protein